MERQNKTLRLNVRINEEEKLYLEHKCKDMGFSTLSEFIRMLILKGIITYN